jgi:sigma-B regulation protein RsbU (phosphoserine phosphatase)
MAILSEVTESTRHAASFNEAIHDALSTVVSRTLASGATLLVRRSPDQPFRCLSSFPGNNQHWTLPQRTLLLNRLLHFYPGLPITQGDLDAFARWAEKSDLSRIEEIGTLQAIGPAAVIPVQVKDEIAGILFVNPAAPKTAFDPSEMRLLRSVASQFALMLENSRLTDRIIEQDRLRRDLALAAEVQQRLFPEHAPEVTTARLSGFCLPARGVGGDLYDFFRLDDRGIGVAIADVAGKGIAAALLTSIIQASLRSLAGTDGDSPAALAAKVNKLLCDSTGPSGYATFFYAKYDEAQRRLCYVNGGHNPPLLLRRDGGPIEELAAGGMIIGMFPFAAYEETLVDVSPGDVLLAYTDGVSEAHNPDEDEFTDGRLKELLRTYSHLPVDEMSTAIFERLKAWMQDAPQFDDLTFVLMKVL